MTNFATDLCPLKTKLGLNKWICTVNWHLLFYLIPIWMDHVWLRFLLEPKNWQWGQNQRCVHAGFVVNKSILNGHCIKFACDVLLYLYEIIANTPLIFHLSVTFQQVYIRPIREQPAIQYFTDCCAHFRPCTCLYCVIIPIGRQVLAMGQIKLKYINTTSIQLHIIISSRLSNNCGSESTLK